MRRKPYNSVKITSAILYRLGACASYRKRFRKKYPRGVWVNRKLIEKMHAHHLMRGWADWAADHLLTDMGKRAYYTLCTNLVPASSTTYTAPDGLTPRTFWIDTKGTGDVRTQIFAQIYEIKNFRKPELE